MKAILPVAGLGTRLLPLTVHQPKAMVSIVDRPMIDYALDEVKSLGIKEIVFVISPAQMQFKRYIESMDYGFTAHFAVQKELSGNADAIYLARPFVKNEPAAVIFQDDVLTEGGKMMREAAALSKKTRSPVLLLERVKKELVSRYGIVKLKTAAPKSKFYEISEVFEKPSPHEAPSNLAVIGRYIATPAVFDSIEKLYYRKAGHANGNGGEVGITDALNIYLKNGGRLLGLELRGKRFDCGSKLGLLTAQMHFALAHKEYGTKLKTYLKGID